MVRGEEKDQFGLDLSVADRLKAANDLEKALSIKEQQEALRKAKEEARAAGEYHIDLDVIADVFHPLIRDVRRGKHTELSLIHI